LEENQNPESASKEKKFVLYDVWETIGITKHWGGIPATRHLIELCNITPGQYVLDVGCGTGFTACLLAKEYHANVVAADINQTVLEWAKKRITKEGLSDRVKTLQADVHDLPFPRNAFGAVIAESVLVVCDKKKAASEINRVLRPGGLFGDNEATWLKPPPPEVVSFLSKSMRAEVEVPQEDGWRQVFSQAGFEPLSSSVQAINYTEQALSQLRVDGIRRYLGAIARIILDPNLRSAYLRRDISRREASQLLSYFGYGLYVSRKVR
jgi:ubiquinone/menaquinone biosynthesis C-methylase UbiE